MDLARRLDLIKRNTAEILTLKDLKELLSSKKKISSYYGIAPTGPVHMGYLTSLSKLFDFSRAGIKNKVLIANVHAVLDDAKASWESVDLITKYCQKCIELSFPWKEKPVFIKGSSFQINPDYELDVFKLAVITTVSRATRAASEVCRMKNPKVSELIYPLMQALDEEYLGVDIQLGGIDQRHILAYAREYLPRIGYKPRVEVMAPLVVSLSGPGVKMSASKPETHIKVHESEENIKKKISKAYCPAGVVEDNPVLQLTGFIVFPLKKEFKIERPPKYGGDIVYDSYEALEKDFVDKKLHPTDLKNALTRELISVFKRVRKYYSQHASILKELGPRFE